MVVSFFSQFSEEDEEEEEGTIIIFCYLSLFYLYLSDLTYLFYKQVFLLKLKQLKSLLVLTRPLFSCFQKRKKKRRKNKPQKTNKNVTAF